MNLDVEIYLETTIRRMRVYDLTQVQAIDASSFSTSWSMTTFRYELLENPNAYCWVAETNSKLVGFVVCWLILDELHIATIAVHPKYRGKKISKQLIRIGLQELIDKGARMATLEVRAGNIVAQGLYRYFGFREVGLRKAYYQDTYEDAILMTVEPLNPDYLKWLNSETDNPWNLNVT